MRVLIACERSGQVRRAMRARGYDAWSCDLEPADDGSPHHARCDALNAAYAGGWDLIIAHPPCTYLANSGARWRYHGGARSGGFDFERRARMYAGAVFFRAMLDAPADFVAVENPIMMQEPRDMLKIPAPSQTIQPWQFGHGETKATCLWLKGLPKLVPTNIVSGRAARIRTMPDSKARRQKRSETYPGIAAAMAEQWGDFASGVLHYRALG